VSQVGALPPSSAARPTRSAPSVPAPAGAPAATATAKEEQDSFSPAPEQVFQRLLEGNERFRNGTARQDGARPEDREELADGQSPEAVVLACSDSRVSPEHLFDQGLGELFVIRGAGNTVTEEELASMEYAVEHLGSKLIVVMGHDSCGAVKAALETPEGKSAGSPNLDKLVSEVREGLEGTELTEADKHDPTAHKAVEANAHSVLMELAEKSPILREKLAKGEIAAVSGVYSLDTGKVEFE
jgi:carbonic anhydrase